MKYVYHNCFLLFLPFDGNKNVQNFDIIIFQQLMQKLLFSMLAIILLKAVHNTDYQTVTVQNSKQLYLSRFLASIFAKNTSLQYRNLTSTDEFQINILNLQREWIMNILDTNISVRKIANEQYRQNITFDFSASPQFVLQTNITLNENVSHILVFNFTKQSENITSMQCIYSSTKILSSRQFKNNLIAFDLMEFYNYLNITSFDKKSHLCITSVNYLLVFQQSNNFTVKISQLQPTKSTSKSIGYLPELEISIQNSKNEQYCCFGSQFQIYESNNTIESHFDFSNSLTYKASHNFTYKPNSSQSQVGYFPFPISISPKIMVQSSYSYQISQNYSFRGMFCFSIGFRRRIMSPTQIDENFKIYVCPYWSSGLIPASVGSGTLSNGQQFFVDHNRTTFFLAHRKSSETNFDLLEYARAIPTTRSLIQNTTITFINAYWICYGGIARVITSDLRFRISQNKTTNRSKKRQQYFQAIGGEKTAKTIGGAVSVPNIGALLKLTPFISLIDDFSYFVYHSELGYDTGFDFISELCWNLTHSKWQPPSAVLQALNMSLSSTQPSSNKWLADLMSGTPKRLKYRTEDLFFLNNCKGYLLYTTPFSVIMFAVLWKIHWKIKIGKIAGFLRSFSSWAFLGVSLLADNAQFLSFRGFSQLRFLVPNGIIGCTSSAIGTFGVATVVLCSICLYALSWQWAHSTFQHVLLKRSFAAFSMVSLWILLKVIEGFVHAIIDNSVVRLSILLGIQLFMLNSLGFCAVIKTQRFKSTYSTIVAGYVLRSLLYIVLLIQIVFKDSINLNNQSSIDTAMSGLTLWLIGLIFICYGLQIICGIASSLLYVQQNIQQNQNIAPKVQMKLNQTPGKQKIVLTAINVQYTLSIQTPHLNNQESPSLKAFVQKIIRPIRSIQKVRAQKKMKSKFISSQLKK